MGFEHAAIIDDFCKLQLSCNPVGTGSFFFSNLAVHLTCLGEECLMARLVLSAIFSMLTPCDAGTLYAAHSMFPASGFSLSSFFGGGYYVSDEVSSHNGSPLLSRDELD